MIPSNEKMAELALRLAHDMWADRGCAGCGGSGNQMHEILGRTMREILGPAVAILGSTCIPLCAKCHAEWEKMKTEAQIEKAIAIWSWTRETALQLTALKSQWNKA
jgi:hypothetical protein